MRKGKVKLSLCLTKYNAMKTYLMLNQAPSPEDVLGEWRYSSFLISALDGMVRFTPRPFYPPFPLDKRLGERCGRGDEEKSHHCPCRELNPGN
jgi:hypothetical protein